MNRYIGSFYIRDNFEPGDRLAVVLLNKQTGDVIQRIATAEKIANDDFQAWLRYQNTRRYEIYVSMNALGSQARGRTKAEIETIRHVYLDFDNNGTEAINRFFARKDLPAPSYLLNTSPDKWQLTWKVRDFGKDQAENLQRALVRETGADPAATDCSRVLRIPGFYNHKYGEPFRVAFEKLSPRTWGPEQFADFSERKTSQAADVMIEDVNHKAPKSRQTVISQSERDWAFAKRALARGDSEDKVIAAIASYRRNDKYNPDNYAELTVRKAAEALNREIIDVEERGHLER